MKEEILTRLNEAVRCHEAVKMVMVVADDLRELILEQGADERNVHNAMEQIAEMSKRTTALEDFIRSHLYDCPGEGRRRAQEILGEDWGDPK